MSVITDDNDKMVWIDALIALVGWPEVCNMVELGKVERGWRIIEYKHRGPWKAGITFFIHVNQPPSHAPWYWKPALYNELTGRET